MPVAGQPAEPVPPAARPAAWPAPKGEARERERRAAQEEVPGAAARRAARARRSARQWGPRSGAWRATAAAQALERGARALREAPGVGERNRGPPEQRVLAGLLRRGAGAPLPRRAPAAPLQRRHSPETRCCTPRSGRGRLRRGPWRGPPGTRSHTTDRKRSLRTLVIASRPRRARDRGGGPRRTPSPVGSWRSSSSPWPARSPAPGA